MNIAINGFGRIGKNFLRTILQDPQARKKIKVVAINLGPGKKEFAGHLFKYDTLMGTYPGSVEVKNDSLIIDGMPIKLLDKLDPADLPWKDLNIDWVVDCSGTCTRRERSQRHIDAGAQKVLISAPCIDEDVTIIPGVNEQAFTKTEDNIVSLGSCTTNALLPMLKVLQQELDFKAGLMTTIHSYTNSQVLLDVDCKDLRRSRAAALNIIPTSTGAIKTVAKVMPDIQQNVDGIALRVPTPNVSIVDLAFTSSKELDVQSINKTFEQASNTYLKNIMTVSHEPLVSSDYAGTNYSVVIDSLLTQAIGNLGKVFGWYDNEWGYSVRLKDFLLQQG